MDYELSYNLDSSEISTWNVINATAFARTSLLYTTDIGHYFCKEKYFTKRRGLNSYLIKITVSGGGCLTYNQQTHSVKIGQVFWIDCSQPQAYQTDPDDKEWEMYWFHFIGPTAAAYYSQFLKSNQNSPVATLSPQSPALGLLQKLEALYASNDPQLVKDINASSLITQILVSCITSTFQTTEQVPEIVQKITYYLQTNYMNKITLDSLGEVFNLNPFYLQKLFKRWVGESPLEYTINLRMGKAKELLASTQMSISEVSYAIGIENPSHFTRQFKALEGMTPQNFRKIWPNFLDEK